MCFTYCDDVFKRPPDRGAPSVCRLVDRSNRLLRRGHGTQNCLRMLWFSKNEHRPERKHLTVPIADVLLTPDTEEAGERAAGSIARAIPSMPSSILSATAAAAEGSAVARGDGAI